MKWEVFSESDPQDYYKPHLAPPDWEGLKEERCLLVVLETVHTRASMDTTPWLRTLIPEGIQTFLLIIPLAPKRYMSTPRANVFCEAQAWGPIRYSGDEPETITNQETFCHKQCCPTTEVTVCLYWVPWETARKLNQKSNSHTAKSLLSILTHILFRNGITKSKT